MALNPRSRLKVEELAFAGADLASKAFPGEIGAALETVLAKAAIGGRLVTLEIRAGDSGALAAPWELLSFPKHVLPVRQGLVEIVRRISSPESRDPAPEVPPEHIAILGFTAAPLEDLAEQALPGTGGIRSSDLFWEREQENLLVALDDLVRTRRAGSSCPTPATRRSFASSSPRRTGPRSSTSPAMAAWWRSGPCSSSKTLRAGAARCGADELLSWMRANPEARRLDLLVLSACDSANAAGLAESLVRNGVPRVLGMQSTVSDHGATAFAAPSTPRWPAVPTSLRPCAPAGPSCSRRMNGPSPR